MKKLLVVLLTVVLTLTVVALASAATFNPYVGGEFQWTYSADLLGDNTPVSVDNGGGTYARYKAYVTGTVEDKDTNTWAKLGVLFKTWNQDVTPSLTLDANKNLVMDDNGNPKFDSKTTGSAVYEAGIKKIGDILDIWYTNDENPNTKRGMVRLDTPPMKFGGDPEFSNGIGNALGFDFNLEGGSAVNVIYCPNKGTDPQSLMVVAGTIKIDGGSVWAGYRSEANKNTVMGVGCQLKAGIGTLSADYISKSPDAGDSTSWLQVDYNMTDLKLDVTLLYDMKDLFPTDGGIGIGAVYSFTDMLSVGVKQVTASDKADNAKDITDYYLGIKYGVFETRIGSGQVGADADSYMYITTHVGMW